jgi:hypothetical protein
MGGAVVLGVAMLIIVAVALYLVGNLVRSIQDQRRGGMKLWKNFGLSLGFCSLFFVSWAAQGIAQWQVFTDHQRAHQQPVELGDFMADFSQATLENWQSEFLQLFAFTVMSALLIHRGSAESKDSDEKIQHALERIEERLGTK